MGWESVWAVVVLVCASGLSVRAQVAAGPLRSPINGHAYYLLDEGSWQDAEALAVGLGGHLATLRSPEEQAWVFDQFGGWGGQSRSLWIGLRRLSPGGPFGWVSGEPITFTHWLPGQPDNSPVTQGESYVHLLNTGNAYGHPGGYWNDLASPNTVFNVFDPVCGVVEVVPPAVSEVGLTMVRTQDGYQVGVTAPITTVRVVWETSAALSPDSWSVVGVQSSEFGRMNWNRPVEVGGASGFHRVRAYDTPGFNARLDRVVRAVRAEYAGAVLLEAFPFLFSTVTGLPDDVELRAVFRVNGGTVIAVQADTLGQPTMEFRAVPWLGDVELPWPIDMALEEAESALHAAGYGSEYNTLTLRRPIYPGMTEPYFIFGTPLNGFVFVGTRSRKVFQGN